MSKTGTKVDYDPIFGFGDGMTGARVNNVEEISETEAQTLRRLCIADFIG